MLNQYNPAIRLQMNHIGIRQVKKAIKEGIDVKHRDIGQELQQG